MRVGLTPSYNPTIYILSTQGGGSRDLSARLKEGPAPCTCGLHPSGDEAQGTGLPLWRIRELNDGARCVRGLLLKGGGGGGVWGRSWN